VDHTPHSSIIDITLPKKKKKRKQEKLKKKWYYVMLLAIYILTISEDLKVVGTFESYQYIKLPIFGFNEICEGSNT
jgi:ABC-type antimicrobial peptide transport system permease subunit